MQFGNKGQRSFTDFQIMWNTNISFKQCYHPFTTTMTVYAYKPYHEHRVHTEILGHSTVPWRQPEAELFFSHYSQIFIKSLKHKRSPNGKVSKTQSSFISNLTYKASFCAKAMLEKLSKKPKQNSYHPNKGSNSGPPEYMISLRSKYFKPLWLRSSLLVLVLMLTYNLK